MQISVLLQHSIRLNHAFSDCPGSMHRLLNQRTVTIRFHILLASAKKSFFFFIFLLLHRQKNERKENLIDFSFSVCLVKNFSVPEAATRLHIHRYERPAFLSTQKEKAIRWHWANHMEKSFSRNGFCVGGANVDWSLYHTTFTPWRNSILCCVNHHYCSQTMASFRVYCCKSLLRAESC